MIRFDANCVLGRWPEGGPTLETAERVRGAMDRLGVAKALVRHSMASLDDVSLGNNLLIEELAGHERLVPCWSALPPITGEMGALSHWLDSLSANGVPAVCIHPASHGYPLTDWQCDSLLGPLAERHYLLIIEVSEVKWEELHWLCESHAGLSVAILNTGYRVLRPLFALLDAHPNLHLDISTLSNFCGIEEACSRFGAERLLFGTGEPRNDGAGAVTALNYAALDRAEIEAIAAGNLERLLAEVQL